MSEKQKKVLIAGVSVAAALLTVLVLAMIIIPGILRQVFVLNYDEYIKIYSFENELDPYLTSAVIFCESKYDPKALSKVGARGLMQIMPATGKEIAENLEVVYDDEILYDPETSIRFGTYYLNYLMERFDRETAVAVAAYNAGPGRVSQWLTEYGMTDEGTIRYIPFGETDRYVKKVLRVRDIYKLLYRNAFPIPEKEQEIIYVADNYSACNPDN